MAIKYTKRNVMYAGNANCSLNMTLNGSILYVVDEIKDLGVIVDSELSVDTHIGKAVARAVTRANRIHKCFVSRDVATKDAVIV